MHLGIYELLYLFIYLFILFPVGGTVMIFLVHGAITQYLWPVFI